MNSVFNSKQRSLAWMLILPMGLATAAGASDGFDCSKLKPTTIQKGEWSSPDNTLRSARFDIFWGDKRSGSHGSIFRPTARPTSIRGKS